MAPPTPHTLIASHSVETIFFGMVCVLYAFCAYTLWGQKSMSCRLLLFINTVQFLLCMIQIILHTIYLFIIFTVFTHVPPPSPVTTPYIVGANVVYTVTFLITSILSIWRLYVLYDNNMRVSIPAFLFWLAQICVSAIAIRICVTNKGVPSHFTTPSVLLWAFITAVNLCVAIPIAIRLYIAQKKTHDVLSRSPLKSIAIISIECGTLITLCSIVMMILQVRAYAYAIVGVGVATNVAVASQLLITARHAILSQDRADRLLDTLDEREGVFVTTKTEALERRRTESG